MSSIEIFMFITFSSTLVSLILWFILIGRIMLKIV